MVKLITISKEGKVIIPMDVRKAIGLKGEEQYVLVTDQGNIILKRVVKNQNQARMTKLVEEFREGFKKAKVKKSDVANAVKSLRAQ